MEQPPNITHPLDEPLLSSPRDFDNFVEGVVWKDIESTIKDRIELLTDDLINSKEDREIYKLQATIQVWKEMLAIPYYLKEHAKIEQQKKDEYASRNQTTKK